jgi:hypothetical protein
MMHPIANGFPWMMSQNVLLCRRFFMQAAIGIIRILITKK